MSHSHYLSLCVRRHPCLSTSLSFWLSCVSASPMGLFAMRLLSPAGGQARQRSSRWGVVRWSVHPSLGQRAPVLPVTARGEMRRRGDLRSTCATLSWPHPWLPRQPSWVGCCLFVSPLLFPAMTRDTSLALNPEVHLLTLRQAMCRNESHPG